ncbi:hypothetical protein MDA_GLEAN10007192 [Myotis davidii]|uniref:Uncharacterized protein n=1 Tax=Myotis davidii TaxID=225400 RepID=L5LKU1_MYODS|nr:hypothetical protein MDA_GLEAN10007192 [Myotis davidii]
MHLLSCPAGLAAIQASSFQHPLPTESPFFPEQLMPASAYNYNYDPVPLDSGPLSASHEALDLEGEAEDR